MNWIPYVNQQPHKNLVLYYKLIGIPNKDLMQIQIWFYGDIPTFSKDE